MPYVYNIPLATDQISISQGQILGNFVALGAIGGNGSNSSAALDATGFKWIYLTSQGAPPAGSNFAAGSIGLYSAVNATTGKNELYVNKTNQATVVQIPTTASILSITSAPGNASNGWSYLPSGILLKWGIDTINGSRNTSSNIPINGFGPAFNQVFSVTANQYYTGGGSSNNNVCMVIQSVGPTQFNVFPRAIAAPSSGVISVMWLAIGY